VKALAEQNTQLIAQLQAQGQQLRRLAWGLVGVGVGVGVLSMGAFWLATR